MKLLPRRVCNFKFGFENPKQFGSFMWIWLAGGEIFVIRTLAAVFDSGNAVLRKTFTPPPHTQNGPEMSPKSRIKISQMQIPCVAFFLNFFSVLSYT